MADTESDQNLEASDKPWECPLACPFQSDDKLLYRFIQRYNHGLRRFRMFGLSAIAIGLIYFWQYHGTDKRPSPTEVLLGFGWLAVSLDRPTLLTDTAAKFLEKFGGSHG